MKTYKNFIKTNESLKLGKYSFTGSYFGHINDTVKML
jgi:hypothetical protein